MTLNEPIDIMLACCIPDKKKLLAELSKLSHGQTLKIKIDDCISSRAMVESYVKNKWYHIVDTVDQDGATILYIRMERSV